MENKPEPYNLGIVVCYSSPDHIVLEKSIPRFKQQRNSKMLVIDRKNKRITAQAIFNTSNLMKRTFSAFLGIVSLEGHKFAVFCDEAKVACSVPKFPIFEISSLFFLSFEDEKSIKRLSCRKEIFAKIRDLNVLLERGFYFSHEYNVSRTYEYQKLDYVKLFTWNQMFLQDILHTPQWVTPIIQGYIGFFEIFVQGTKIYYLLVSRRSTKKGGTRYFDRGIDQNGYVANYVETEQIIQINEYVISDVQIRGSVPLFFEQKGLTTQIKLTRGYELTHEIMQKHLRLVIREYERIFWVNLLSMGRKGEVTLIKELEKHIRDLDEKELKYMYFDFHKHVHGGKFEKADLAIESVKEMKKNLKFFIYDTQKEEVLMRQQGAFRTNCLDSLDRTNFFQAKLAMLTLEEILASFQITFSRSLCQMMSDPTEESYEIVNFRKIWADNGDMISYHYTGTGSTHTDIIRDGKRGLMGDFKHKYKSIARFYNQNFWDFYKMKLVDLLLGNSVGEVETVTIPALINERMAEFCEPKIIDIYLFTWKTPKKLPSSLPLFPNTSDLLVVSLQEISDEQQWKNLVSNSTDLHNYNMVSQKCSNKNLLMIFIKKSLSNAVSSVELTKVKFKSMYNTYLSTKCAVIIRFNLYSTKLTFVGVQLEYGREYPSNRIENLKDIHKHAFQEQVVGQKKSGSILDDDVIFMMGNFNTNISSNYKSKFAQFSDVSAPLNLESRRLVSEMLESDEFPQIQQRLLNYRYYQEEEIKFPPSYKYNKSKRAFDPEFSGWPDRIWYSTEKKIICSKYCTAEEMRDEHVPVVASYQLQVDKIDEDIRMTVSEEVFARMSETQGFELESSEKQEQSEIKQNTGEQEQMEGQQIDEEQELMKGK